MKDGPAEHGSPMVAAGAGTLNFEAIVSAQAGPADWVVELDECATDPFEAARASRCYLERLASLSSSEREHAGRRNAIAR